MRQALMMVVVAGMLGVMAAGAGAERAPATLVGPGVAGYVELNLDRLQGKTADLVALREAFAKMQVLKVAAQAFSHDPEVKGVFEEVMGVVTGLNDAFGPRLAVAVWAPDLAPLMGAAVSGNLEGEAEPPGMPKFLLVVELKDRAKFEQIWGRLVERLEIPVGEEERKGEVTRTPFEVGGGLARGNDWLALGYPTEVIEEAEERATGRLQKGSLAEDSAYGKVMVGLPQDAVVTAYVGPQVLRQLAAAATLLMPSVQFSLPTKEGLGVAVGMRLEENTGTKMLTVYKATDLDALSYLLDVPLSMAAMAAYPAFVKSREAPLRTRCLSNVKNISLAVVMYVADTDRFPDADKWVEQLEEYLVNEDVLKCPKEESEAKCSYGFNAALSGKPISEIADPAEVVVIYETAHPGDCPSGGVDDIVSPPRHQGGSNFGYADGHAKWCREGEEIIFEETAEEEETEDE